MYFIENTMFKNPSLVHTSTPFFRTYRIEDLPASYLSLLSERNGGYLRMNSLPTTEPTRDGLDSVNFHYLFGLHSDEETSLLFQEDYHERFSLPDYLLFFSVNEEQLWAFDYSSLKNDEPSIRYLDMDTDQWLFVADSFAEFLRLLKLSPLDLNEERILSRHEANHDFLLASAVEIENLLLRFEDYSDKYWYFSWLIYLAKSKHADLQKLAFTAFETQIYYFNPSLPTNKDELVAIFQQVDTSIINQTQLQQLLKE